MKLTAQALPVLAVWGTTSIVQAQAHLDILQIWQNFVASREAAMKCDGLDRATDQKFLSNFTEVTVRATQAVQQQSPSSTPTEITVRVTVIGDDVRGKVDAEIAQTGCSSSKIQQLLQLYKMHSAMNLRGSQ